MTCLTIRHTGRPDGVRYSLYFWHSGHSMHNGGSKERQPRARLGIWCFLSGSVKEISGGCLAHGVLLLAEAYSAQQPWLAAFCVLASAITCCHTQTCVCKNITRDRHLLVARPQRPLSPALASHPDTLSTLRALSPSYESSCGWWQASWRYGPSRELGRGAINRSMPAPSHPTPHTMLHITYKYTASPHPHTHVASSTAPPLPLRCLLSLDGESPL